MNKRGPKPKKVISEVWNSNLAYAVGLLTSDGCLGNDNLLIDLTSKDEEQLINFSKCLDFEFKIGKKCDKKGHNSFRIQFKNRIFYDFLLSIGLTPKKSLTIKKVDIPKHLFFDFLRGYFDGDGCSYSYWDSRWKTSFLFYIEFVSGSEKFISWLRKKIKYHIKVCGHMVKNKTCFQLKYSKKEALQIVSKMYYNPNVVCLSRKRLKIMKVLKIIKQQKEYARVEKR